MKKSWLLLFCLLQSALLHASEHILIIKDAKDGKAVTGAVVLLSHPSGKTTIHLPDYKGRVALTISESDKQAIQIKCIGYISQQLNILTEKEQTIQLQRSEISLSQVAITSTYTPVPVMQSAYSVKVIDKTQITAMAAVNAADVLGKQLNMRTGYDQAFGSTLTMQGMDMNNIKVLMDGVPVIGRMNGNIDLSQLNTSNVERIEVVEGPMSSSYGTDAIAGVINIITKPQNIRKNSATATAYYENIGTYNTDISAQAALNKISLKLSAGRNFFEGWNLTDDRRVYQWKPKTQYYGSALASAVLGKLKLNYQISLFDEKITDKGPVTITPFSAYAYDSYYKTLRHNQVMSYDYYLNDKNKINGHISYSSYNRRKEVFYKDMVALQQTELTTPEFRDTTSFDAWNIRSVWNHINDSKKINFQAGIDFNLESGSGKRLDVNRHIDDYALFASAEYTGVKNLLIRPGIRYSYNTMYDAPLIPSVNVKYDLTSSLAVRASYSKGFRAPGLKELYLDFVDINHNIQGNPNIKPESSDNYQLSLTHHYKTGKLTLQSEIKGFYNKVSNLITLAQYSDTSNLYTYINVGHYTATGTELTETVAYGNWTVSAGLAYTGNSSQSLGVNSSLEWFTQLNGSLGWQWPRYGIDVNAYYKYNGAMPVFVVDNTEEKSILRSEAYQVLDVIAGKKLWNEHITLSAGVKNIFNVTSIRQMSSGQVHGSSSTESSVLPGRLLCVKLQLSL